MLEECLGCGRSSCICCEHCGNAPCLCHQICEDCENVWFSCQDKTPITDGPLKGKIVKVDGFHGVACLVVSDDGENKCVVVMVGDDQKHSVDREDCKEINRTEFCSGCGQTGCCFNTEENDE